METLNLKAIPICYEKNAYHLTEKEFNIILNIKYRESKKGFFLSESCSVLQDKGLVNLKKFLVQKAEDYAKNILEVKDKIYLTQSWSTFLKKNAFHPPHNHPNSFISAVYYVQCDKGFLVFEVRTSSIQEGFNFDYKISRYNIYNSQSWDLPVKSGSVVLFPGHVSHTSSPHLSSTPRILIGANFFVKGQIGTQKNVSILKI